MIFPKGIKLPGIIPSTNCNLAGDCPAVRSLLLNVLASNCKKDLYIHTYISMYILGLNMLVVKSIYLHAADSQYIVSKS